MQILAHDAAQAESAQRFEDYPRKTATPDLKRKSGVETVCLPHAASSHRSMHIKPHPPHVTPSGPTSESITPISTSKPSTPPRSPTPVIASVPVTTAPSLPPAASVPLIGIASPAIASNSFVPNFHGHKLFPTTSTSFESQHKMLTPKIEIPSESASQSQPLCEKIVTPPVVPKIEEQLPPPASPKPISFEEIHVEIEQPPPPLIQPELVPEFKPQTINDLPDKSTYDITERISAYPEPTGVESEGPFAIRKLGKLTSPASDSYIGRPIKKAHRPFSAGIDPKLFIDPENPPMDAYSSLEVDLPVRIGESAMSPCCEEDIHLLTLGAPTIYGDKGNLLAPFDGMTTPYISEAFSFHERREPAIPPPETKSRPLDPVYFSDDDVPKSPDEIGSHNVAWLGDPLPKPPTPRVDNEFNPFEKLKFKKRKKRKLPEITPGAGPDVENDSSQYDNEMMYPNLRLEAVYNEWQKNGNN